MASETVMPSASIMKLHDINSMFYGAYKLIPKLLVCTVRLHNLITSQATKNMNHFTLTIATDSSPESSSSDCRSNLCLRISKALNVPSPLHNIMITLLPTTVTSIGSTKCHRHCFIRNISPSFMTCTTETVLCHWIPELSRQA